MRSTGHVVTVTTEIWVMRRKANRKLWLCILSSPSGLESMYNWNCRGQIDFAVAKLILPWPNWYCRGQIDIAVAKLILPWQLWATVETRPKAPEKTYRWESRSQRLRSFLSAPRIRTSFPVRWIRVTQALGTRLPICYRGGQFAVKKSRFVAPAKRN